MAILNIKSFPNKLYSKIKAKAKRERRSIAQEVIHIIDSAMSESSQLSILELQGLGKKMWQHVDAQEHINQERQAWD